jgi:hypothetical protein
MPIFQRLIRRCAYNDIRFDIYYHTHFSRQHRTPRLMTFTGRFTIRLYFISLSMPTSPPGWLYVTGHFLTRFRHNYATFTLQQADYFIYHF